MTKEFKTNLKTEWLSLTLIAVSIIVSGYFYANFPAEVVTHWNFQGQADGWSSKAFAAFFFPALIIFFYLMFLFLPKIDPKKEKYQQFSKAYNIFKTILIAFLTGVYFVIGLQGLGYDFNVGGYVAGGVGLLLIIMGNYMSKLKSNWFVGIRTPWTLSSETVWNKTHRIGGKVFIISGLLIAMIPWLKPDWQIPVFSTAIILMALGTFVYSYFVYRQEQK